MSAGQPQHGRAGGRGRRYLHEVRGQARSHQKPAPTLQRSHVERVTGADDQHQVERQHRQVYPAIAREKQRDE